MISPLLRRLRTLLRCSVSSSSDDVVRPTQTMLSGESRLRCSAMVVAVVCCSRCFSWDGLLWFVAEVSQLRCADVDCNLSCAQARPITPAWPSIVTSSSFFCLTADGVSPDFETNIIIIIIEIVAHLNPAYRYLVRRIVNSLSRP